MAQIPYTGTVDVSPQVDPLANVSVHTPVEAFGGAVAGAVTHMGEMAQGAGKELFSRAYAMQELNQQDQANAGVAQFQNEMTMKFVDYTKKQGQDAIHGLPGFMTDTDTLRQKYADNMPSDYAKQQFNNESRMARSRMIMSAGNYAREEMKRFTTESTEMQTDAIANRAAAAASTGDVNGLSQAAADARKKAESTATEHGLDPQSIEEAGLRGSSKVMSRTLGTLVKTQPIQVQRMLDEAVKNRTLSSVDAQNLQPTIDHHLQQQGARDISTTVRDGTNPAWDTTSVGPARMKDVLSKSSGTAGYESVGPEDKNGNGHAIGQYGVPSSELPRWLADAGMKPMSEDQFLKDHAAQDQLAMFKGDEFQKKYGSTAEMMKAWTSGIDADNRIKQGRRAVADSASHGELQGVTEKAADTAVPGNQVVKDIASEHVRLARTRADTDKADDERATYNTVAGGVNQPINATGKLPTSINDIADPAVRDAYEKLDEKGKASVAKAFETNINRQYQPTPAAMAKFQWLRGISVDPNSTRDEREELLKTDTMGFPGTPQMRNELDKAKARVNNGAFANPNVEHALQVLSPQLRANGLDKQSNPSGYAVFTGALHDAMMGQAAGQLKAVKSDDEIQKMGTSLLRSLPGTGGWFSRDSKAFEAPGDTKATALARQSLTKSMGRDPSQEEVANFLLRLQFQLSGAKGKSQ